VLTQDSSQAPAGDHADFGARELDGRHERKGHQREPQGCKAEGGAGHRVGTDPRGIVVRGTGHQTGAEHLQELLDRIGFAVGIGLDRAGLSGWWLVRDAFCAGVCHTAGRVPLPTSGDRHSRSSIADRGASRHELRSCGA
jgi:hypothetical protein